MLRSLFVQKGFRAFQMCKANRRRAAAAPPRSLALPPSSSPPSVVRAPFRDSAPHNLIQLNPGPGPARVGFSSIFEPRRLALANKDSWERFSPPVITIGDLVWSGCLSIGSGGDASSRSPDPRSGLTHPPTHPQRKSRGRGSTQMDGGRRRRFCRKAGGAVKSKSKFGSDRRGGEKERE